MPRPKSTTLIKREIKRQNAEIAAIAAVKMENSDYRYPKGALRCYDEEGNETWNKNELVRLAGCPGYVNGHVEKVLNDEYFIEMVELHRLRRRDPMFREKLENPTALWEHLGKKALDNIYEKLEYSPHSLTLDENMKVVRLVLDAGVIFDSREERSKSADLLATLTPEQRERMLDGREKRAQKQLDEVKSLRLAHKGADAKEANDEA